MRLILLGVAALGLAGCNTPEPQADRSDSEPAAAAEPDISEPPDRTVIMTADPPPPFTYWAPEGAEIRNHPTNPGIWMAYVDGRQTGGFYFGDGCGASRRQHWIGRLRSDLPPAEASWRVFETGQAMHQDLRPDRTNIEIDPATQRVVSIACH